MSSEDEILGKYKQGKFFKHEGDGMFDIPQGQTCLDPNHYPPTNLHIPQGKGYKHTCRTCGTTFRILGNQTTL